MTAPVVQHLSTVIAGEIARGAHGPWVLAFSGGPDSTALAAALAEISPGFGIAVHAFHVDHALDEGSAARALAAGEIAAALGLPFVAERHPVNPEGVRREGTESAARRARYAALERFRVRLGADRILTAHHADDQIETLLLRLRAGSGISGLAGMRRSGTLFRPALGLRRTALADLVAERGLRPVVDPTNLHLGFDRNQLRLRTLPRLLLADPDLAAAVTRVAAAASRARSALDLRIDKLLVRNVRADGVEIPLAALLALPTPLQLLALARVESLSGRPLPASTRSKVELLRQLVARPEAGSSGAARPAACKASIGSVGADGLAWQLSEGRLRLSPVPRPGADFSYILSLPGEVSVPEIQARLRLGRQPFSKWMKVGEPRRAALAIPASGPPAIEIRNRRPGDRIQPLGGPGIRRLKDLLTDRKVPSAQRAGIPLLIVDGVIAWVPGVTVSEQFRLQDESPPWVVEWIDDPEAGERRITIEDAPAESREELTT
ncbi:MAG: tRNA lysidine(34) synthetase TilS [Thermoanaerobaculia bacterium]